MQFLKNRFEYLFRSTRGLTLVAIAVVSIVTAIFGTLSGPMVEWGIKDVTVRLLGMKLVEAEREGRIIMLYHTIAMTIIAIEVYFMTEMLPMKRYEKTIINGTITIGYLTGAVFGLLFAYWGHNFIYHGLFLLGQSLVFFAGILLSVALFPWRKEYRLPADSPYAHTKSGLDLERTAFFVMAVSTLLSASFGAVTGSYWGNGHETFLAEDLIRNPYKTVLQKAIIGHLHIMLTLIAIAITLIVGRWMKFKGILHRIAMPLMIWGTIIITAGALSVVWVEWAHTIIYVGSVFVMLAALMYVIYSWDMLIKEGTADIEKPTGWQKFKALLRDPLKFGPGWQMVFMNFTVSGVGIFMAVKLTEIFRVWPHREERITLTGHWHILASLIATIILFYFADLSGLKGKARKWFGWLVIIMSDIAFASVTVFSMKRLFVTEAEQQSVVNWLMLFIDIGLAMVLVALAVFMIWRLYDLLQAKGYWTQEFNTERKTSAQAEIEEQKRKLKELEETLKEVSK
jgi:large-conductance mechanosensitive channel